MIVNHHNQQLTKRPTAMTDTNVVEFSNPEITVDPLKELLIAGAREMLQKAIEAEVADYLESFADRQTDTGRRAVVRSGYQPDRAIQTGLGPVTVKVPKVRSRDGEPVTFRSALVPPYVRKAKSLEAAIPWLYLKGISSGEMDSALKVLVGSDAQGLSASTVSRLKQVWAEDYATWRKRDLSKETWVYIWADGIYSGLRAEDAKLCALVITGVNERGEKRFLAIEDGIRESTQSWREVLLDLQSRGMNTAKLAIGDGAMGFWAALDEVYPGTRHQRCWVHKSANILNYLPKSVQPKAKVALYDISKAETKTSANAAFDLFIKTYEAKYPQAVNCLIKDRDELMAFYDFPAMHWQSIRSTNVIESTFGTIRHRTKRSKGCLSRNTMLHMMFKLSECAETNWRKLRGFKDLGKLITGIKFKDGVEQKIQTNQNAA